MQNQTIYKVGNYAVIPLIAVLVVRDKQGREMYRTADIEDAIEAADDMAQLDLAA